MRRQFSIETAACAEQQRLCDECQKALEVWNDRRAEFCQSLLSRKEAGDELLRLQAKYARAYTVLRSHARNCAICQLASRMEGQDSENRTNASSDSGLQTWF
jgi:hypothetical protein